MTWQDIAEIHQMGFEIGNHSWTHPFFSVPRDAARLPAELALVEFELRKVGVPRPTSFAWCSDFFCTQAVENLAELGYKLARRGMQPEVPFGEVAVGPTYNPQKQNPLLIPTTGDNYPGWTLEHFRKVAERARPGEIVVYQFHGIPDPHPFVNCPPDHFRIYMEYLKREGFRVVALRDLEQYVPKSWPADPLLTHPYLGSPTLKMMLPTEMEATRADLGYWLVNMIHYHRYTPDEIEKVTGVPKDVWEPRIQKMALDKLESPEPTGGQEPLRVLPYPGGRHPRLGALEEAILPQRGTKASVFLPWDAASYVVIDLPEAIFSNLGLTFQAHTYAPTIWDDQNIWLENVDWDHVLADTLTESRVLPNQITFGSSAVAYPDRVDMELWLRNDSLEKLTGLTIHICVMLKGASGFNMQTNDNKTFRNPVSAVASAQRDRWILLAWERSARAWGDPLIPSLQINPVLPDCGRGQTVRVRGRLWFYQGSKIDAEIERTQREFAL